mgnify:CR=1 FL=1
MPHLGTMGINPNPFWLQPKPQWLLGALPTLMGKGHAATNTMGTPIYTLGAPILHHGCTMGAPPLYHWCPTSALWVPHLVTMGVYPSPPKGHTPPQPVAPNTPSEVSGERL